MKIEIKEVSSVQRELTLTIDAETATKDYMTVLNGFKKLANIPGFRKGKAPMKMVETMYGEYAKDEYFNKKLSDYYREALDTKEENPVNVGEAQDFEWNKGEDLVVTFKYEVMPAIEIANYKGLEIPYEAIVFEEKMIDETLKDFRKQMATEEDADTAEMGDTVTAKVQFIDEASAVTKELNRTIVLGDNVYSSKLDVALTGQKIGAIIKAVLFDADSEAKPEDEEFESAVLDREFQVEILEVKRKILPEVNDEFAKDMEYDTLEDMRGKIAEQLQIKLNQDNENNRRDSIVKGLLDANSFELPETMIENYAKSIAEPQAKQYKMEVDKLIPIFRSMAEYNMKGYYMMDALMTQEHIEVTDEDREATIKDAAANLQIDEEKYRELYKKQIEGEDFNHAIKEKKLLDFIAANNTFIPYPEKEVEESETDSQEKE